jgi:hypothetical protein
MKKLFLTAVKWFFLTWLLGLVASVGFGVGLGLVVYVYLLFTGGL